MKRIVKVVLVVTVVIAIIFAIQHPVFKYTASFIFDSNDRQLRDIVERNIKDQKGTFAVVVKGLWKDSNIQYSYNAQEIYPSASLYKLFLIAEVLDQINQGKFKEEDKLSADSSKVAAVLQEEDIHKGKLEYGVGEALNRVAAFSDNYAAIMLAEKVGWDNVQNQANKIGATATNIKEPISTNAADTALFLEKLYKGEIVSQEVSKSIIDRLLKSEVNDRIPAGIKMSTDYGLQTTANPEKAVDGSPKAESPVLIAHEGTSVRIAHKTGELPKVRHDAGIVFLENKPYLIVMMSKDLQYEDVGVETLANISKEVFDYISSKGP